MKKLILFIAMMGEISFFASAQTTPRVTKKQVKQNVRISSGVASGDLTRREAQKLQQQQFHIQKEGSTVILMTAGSSDGRQRTKDEIVY